MQERKRFPIGVQDFASLREGGFAYVDKTEYIYNLVHSSKQYFLSRPRRFGKSLFLSTLKAYWLGKQELFQGLKILELEGDRQNAWQAYPVLYFDFNAKNYQVDNALQEVGGYLRRRCQLLLGGKVPKFVGISCQENRIPCCGAGR